MSPATHLSSVASRPAADCRPASPGLPLASADVLVHLAAALSGHARKRRGDGMGVPPLVEELTSLLLDCVRARQDATALYGAVATPNDAAMPTRLLLTKGETAARLGVSVRTVERLVAAGRLPVVHVEGACRIRVAQVTAYVEELAAESGPAQVAPGPIPSVRRT